MRSLIFLGLMVSFQLIVGIKSFATSKTLMNSARIANPTWGCLKAPAFNENGQESEAGKECLFVKFQDPVIKIDENKKSARLDRNANLVIARCPLGQNGETEKCRSIYDGTLDRLCNIPEAERVARIAVQVGTTALNMHVASRAAASGVEKYFENRVAELQALNPGRVVHVQNLGQAISVGRQLGAGTAGVISMAKSLAGPAWDYFTDPEHMTPHQYDEHLKSCDPAIPLPLLVRIGLLNGISDQFPTGRLDNGKPELEPITTSLYEQTVEQLGEKAIGNHERAYWNNFEVKIANIDEDRKAISVDRMTDAGRSFEMIRPNRRSRCAKLTRERKKFNGISGHGGYNQLVKYLKTAKDTDESFPSGSVHREIAVADCLRGRSQLRITEKQFETRKENKVK